MVVEDAVVASASAIGDSVAVNGCCLTVVELDGDSFTAELSQETLSRTTLGSLRRGDRVNLERPLSMSDRLGGHIVQGHVDGVGMVTAEAPELEVGLDPSLSRYLVDKGSVAVDGVSLTVVTPSTGVFGVSLISHTASSTTLGLRRKGDAVNIEIDVMAKYAEALMRPYLQSIDSPTAGARSAGIGG